MRRMERWWFSSPASGFSYRKYWDNDDDDDDDDDDHNNRNSDYHYLTIMIT